MPLQLFETSCIGKHVAGTIGYRPSVTLTELCQVSSDQDAVRPIGYETCSNVNPCPCPCMSSPC